MSPNICSDLAGGALITWEDERTGSFDIYAQRVDKDGNFKWTSGGVAICSASGDQSYPEICSDGVGGAIITWEDDRGADANIYAQRINMDGAVQWTSGGIAICTASDS